MTCFSVESWAPEYGAAVEDSALTDSDVPVDVAVEVTVEQWAPRRPPAAVEQRPLLFVDGVRRIEARVWVTGDDGEVRQGICASYAAGAVRCNHRAEVVSAEVRRGLFCPAEGADDVETRYGRFRLTPVTGDDAERLSLCLQQRMGDLEAGVAAHAALAHAGELIVVDGPLRQHQGVPNAVGFIKTLHRSYGPPVVLDTAGALAAGERTPVFLVGDRFIRFSWYLRLPTGGPPEHRLAGLVRCEVAGDLPVTEVTALADRVAATVPAFASRPHKDSRAPQNLYPIAGLERELRRRLGDPALLYRGLREAAAASTGSAGAANVAPQLPVAP